MVSTDGDGSGGSTALLGSSSVLARCQYARCDFTHIRIQHRTVSFFCRKPYLKAIGMLSGKADHRERGL
jgi:hypothetical protein